MTATPLPPIVKPLRHWDYTECWQAMRVFTDRRDASTADEIWQVEHPPVYTQGQAGKPEHLLGPTEIPIVQSDRGGQITYHGPGQIVLYPLLDLRRYGLGVRTLVSLLESVVIDVLAGFDIEAKARRDAPGVYVEGRKIASLGLRVRRGCSYHGLALNVATDLRPFTAINPCGHPGLEMENLNALLSAPEDLQEMGEKLTNALMDRLARVLEGESV